MCVTYFYQSEARCRHGYWMILANNRDEIWSRPTKPADFWGEEKDCLSGLDEKPGRQGGTWLGMNTHGKVAVLLNILCPHDHSKKGRGHLISNYLSSDVDLVTYAEKIFKEKEKYHGFNLVLFDLRLNVDSVIHKPVYISNNIDYPSTSNVPLKELPANTFHGLSNSPMEHPFQKVETGKVKFRNVVSKYPALSQKKHLIDSIFDLLQDRTCLLPDSVLERAAASVNYSPTTTAQHSAINVYSPEGSCGTTVSTVILIDGQGKIDYVEKTTDFLSGNEPTVSIIHKNFHLDGSCMTDENQNDL